MTSGARRVRMLSHQLESGLVVIECRRFPPDRRMALGALRAQHALMRVVCAMAVYAELRRAFEVLIRVAPGTGRIHMLAYKPKSRLVMIERRWLPASRCMAAGALAERTLMRVVLAVAIHAHRRRAFKDLVGMAFVAGHVGVQADELESGSAVIERREFPAIGGVAFGAVGAQCAVVRIILAMAVRASLRGAYKSLVGMAFVTRHTRVLAGETEDRLSVVEGGLFPVVRKMAFGAVVAQGAFVRVIAVMTIGALLRETLEDIIDVALGALDVHMLAYQLEDGLIVVEMDLFPIIRRVAFGAVRAQLAFVCVILAVAVHTLV